MPSAVVSPLFALGAPSRGGGGGPVWRSASSIAPMVVALVEGALASGELRFVHEELADLMGHMVEVLQRAPTSGAATLFRKALPALLNHLVALTQDDRLSTSARIKTAAAVVAAMAIAAPHRQSKPRRSNPR